MKKETKQEILWHIKNALTKKIILLPFIAPCYSAWYGISYIGLYLSYFIRVVMLKTDKERDVYFSKVSIEMDEINKKAIFAFYAFTMTCIYWFLIGYDNNSKTLLEFLNFPTYTFFTIPIKAIEILANTPVKYVRY